VQVCRAHLAEEQLAQQHRADPESAPQVRHVAFGLAPQAMAKRAAAEHRLAVALAPDAFRLGRC